MICSAHLQHALHTGCVNSDPELVMTRVTWAGHLDRVEGETLAERVAAQRVEGKGDKEVRDCTVC